MARLAENSVRVELVTPGYGVYSSESKKPAEVNAAVAELLDRHRDRLEIVSVILKEDPRSEKDE